MTLWIDIETYSSVDITKSNVYRYVEAPDFEVMMAGWTTDGVNYQLAIGAEEISAIPGLLTDVKVAHNAPFERICLSAMLGIDLPAEDFIDTRALAAFAGYPQSLENCAVALKVEHKKDPMGKALIRLFCQPNRGKRVAPEDHPEKWQHFCDYCVQDVRALYDIHEKLPELPEMEQKILLVDQRINDRGIKVDVALAQAAVAAAEENKMVQELEVTGITGVKNPGSRDQMLAWLGSVGSPLPDLTADTVRAALQGDLEPTVRRVLELRQDLALTASAKYVAAVNGVCADGRLRGVFFYHGAHTGRWTAKGVQLHNLPRLAFTRENPLTGEKEYDIAAERAAILDLVMGLGVSSEDLKRLIRPMFTGPFTVVDFRSVEAMIVAWLAGETWVLDALRKDRDIYVETAQRMGGLTRFQGKVAVLALGYQGAIMSLRNLGAVGTDAELLRMVRQWRKANPATVRFWYKLEQAFVAGGVAGKIKIVKDGRDRHIHLPSGRVLVYHDVRRYDGQLSFKDPRGYRTSTYGGKLTENITQATARDLLAEALVRLEEAGYFVVGHVHDEGLVESEDVDGITKIMCEPPTWGADLPVGAEGFITERYRKG